jgi:subtilisin-like proprotein convertase family protein
MLMKILNGFAVLAVLAFAPTVFAGTTVYSWTGSQAIPDNNANGVAYSFYLNTPTPETVTSVSVSLNIAGGWNGDLYAYLSHGSGFSVLLNRIGRTALNPDGSPVSGLNATFSDSFATDIHTFNGAVVSGNFAPDGRAVSPYAVLDTDARTALLNSFVGLNSGGMWTLFIADVSPIAVSTVQGWSVTINTVPVPEPGTLAILSVGVFALAWRKRRQV